MKCKVIADMFKKSCTILTNQERCHRLFAQHGVEPAVFKNLMKQAICKTVPTREALINNGQSLYQVHILVDGTAVAYSLVSKKSMYHYSSQDNGCIIGATAVADSSIIGRVYPNRILVEQNVATSCQLS